MYTEHAGH